MEKLPTFYRFLRENSAYFEYDKELLRYNTNLCHLMRKHTTSDLISAVFPWNDTVKGFRYWSDLDIKWHKTIITIKFGI